MKTRTRHGTIGRMNGRAPIWEATWMHLAKAKEGRKERKAKGKERMDGDTKEKDWEAAVPAAEDKGLRGDATTVE